MQQKSKNILFNVAAVIAGLLIGGFLYGTIISVSNNIIPPPAGADLKTEAGLKAAMHLMEPKHFLMPFLAHALGTLVGAFVCTKIARTHQLILALIIGAIFLSGGIMMVMMLPSPLWFTALDLGLAYIPMAWLGWKLAGSKK